jgi:hypothetical protein
VSAPKLPRRDPMVVRELTLTYTETIIHTETVQVPVNFEPSTFREDALAYFEDDYWTIQEQPGMSDARLDVSEPVVQPVIHVYPNGLDTDVEVSRFYVTPYSPENHEELHRDMGYTFSQRPAETWCYHCTWPETTYEEAK